MVVELAYAMITPYSLLKSRTGGIIGRLLSQANLQFVGARMYAPSDAFVDGFRETIEAENLAASVKETLAGYVDEDLRATNPFGISNRVVVLLFEGEDAVNVLSHDVIGELSPKPKGDTVRGTFGDYVQYGGGKVKYFEPAVLCATTAEAARRQLQILADFANSDGGIVEDAVPFGPGTSPQTTLVLLKPDLFVRRSSRAGNIIDMFSKTGLYIVSVDLVHITVAEAEVFYGPLREDFVERLKPALAQQLDATLGQSLDFRIPPEAFARMAELLKEQNAEREFDRIIEYMTGVDRSKVERLAQKELQGSTKCLALLYKGIDAVAKIRERLGSTDPAKAAPGTVRSDYGLDLMKNGAHASDSVENAERERKILGLWENPGRSDFRELLLSHLRRSG